MLTTISLKYNRQFNTITLEKNEQTGEIKFHLIDKVGFLHHVTLAVIPGFGLDDLSQLQNSLSHGDFICEWLNQYIRRNPNSFFIQKVNQQSVIVFAQQGLKGGGRDQWLALSALKVAAGVVLIGTGIGTIAGAGLLSSGISSGVYIYQNNEEDISVLEYAKKSTIGAIAGLATGGTASAVGVGLGGAMAGGAVGTVASDVADSVLHDRPLPNVAASAVRGAILASVSSGVSSLIPENSMDAVTSVFTNSASSGSAAAVTTMVSNVLEGRDLGEGVLESAAIASAVGGAIGGVRVANRQPEIQTTPSKSTSAQSGNENLASESASASSNGESVVPSNNAELEAAKNNLVETRNKLAAAENSAQQRKVIVDQATKHFESRAERGYKHTVDGKKVPPTQAAEYYADGRKVKFNKHGKFLGVGKHKGSIRISPVSGGDVTQAQARVSAAQNQLNELLVQQQSVPNQPVQLQSTQQQPILQQPIQQQPIQRTAQQLVQFQPAQQQPVAQQAVQQLPVQRPVQQPVQVVQPVPQQPVQGPVQQPVQVLQPLPRQPVQRPVQEPGQCGQSQIDASNPAQQQPVQRQAAAYPSQLNKFGIYRRKLTPARVAHALWLVDNRRVRNPDEERLNQRITRNELLRQFTLWSQSHLNAEESKRFLEDVNAEGNKYRRN